MPTSQKVSAFVFIFLALTLSVLPLRVQAALPKELPAAPTKFLTGACLTRSEDLWITAEAGGVYRLSGQEMKPKWCPVPLRLGKISFPRHPQPTNPDTTEDFT